MRIFTKSLVVFLIFITAACNSKPSESEVRVAAIALLTEDARSTVTAQSAVTLTPKATRTAIPTARPTSTRSIEIGERGNPYPIGMPVYLQNNSTEFVLTVKEVIRGEEAWLNLQNRRSSNRPADPGYEYILVFLELSVTSGPNDSAIEMWRYDFEWVTQNQVLDYYTNNVKFVTVPEPEFDLTLYPDSSSGGWIVVQVKIEDDRPLLVFARSSSNPGFFFTLYEIGD